MKVLLFAIRSSHKKFFIELKKEDNDFFDIVYPRYKLSLSFKGLKSLTQVDFNPSINFAVDEFRVKVLALPKPILKPYFKILALFYYLKYYSLFNKNYRAILLWNGGKYRQRIILEIAKLHNIKPIFFENGLLPNRLVLDAKGINAENSVPREREFFENYNNELELPTSLIPRNAKNKKKFSVELKALPSKFIFVPFQVDSDTQIISNSQWVKNMREFFNLIEKISFNSKYHFILKEHPSSSRDYADLHKRAEELTNISFANGYATQELIEKSCGVITINSTVGIESLLFHKKVIVLGDAFYRIDGITKGVSSENELLTVLNGLDDWVFDRELVEKFLKYLYYDYLIPKDDDLYKNFYKFIKNEIK